MAVLVFTAVRAEGRARRALAQVRSERDRAVRAEQRERELRLAAQLAQQQAAHSARAEQQAARRADGQRRIAETASARAEAQQRRAETSAAAAQHQEHLARQAETRERDGRRSTARLLYDANLQLAARAWDDGATWRVKELLAMHVPKPGEEDLRSFDWRYQWKLLNGGGVTFRGHAGAVTHGAIAPDGHLVTIDDDLQLRHWDTRTRRPTKTLNLATECDLYRLALSHDGQTVVARTPSGDIRLLDTNTGRLQRVLHGHGHGAIPRVGNDWTRHFVSSLEFSRDDRQLVSLGNFDRMVWVWDTATGRVLRHVQGLAFEPMYDRLANRLTLSPDGTLLSLVQYPGSNWNLALLDLKSPVARDKFVEDAGQGGSVHSVAYSPDGKVVATGNVFGEITLYDPVAGKRARDSWVGHTRMVMQMQFSPDGKMLATGGWDTLVKLWDVATGKELHVLKGHTEPITFLAFSADGKMLASGSRDGTARLWDLDHPPETPLLKAHHNGIQPIAFSPDGRYIATGAWDRTACIWDVRNRRLLHTLPPQEWAVLSLAFSPDCRTLATGTAFSHLRLWDVATGRMRRKLWEMPRTVGPNYVRTCNSLLFSPDGKLLVAGYGSTNWGGRDYEPVLRVWDTATWRPLRTLHGHRHAISALAFSADGKILVTGSYDRTVRFWQAGTWRLLRTLADFSERVESVILSPDGRKMAVGCADGSIYWREFPAGKVVRVLNGHRMSARSIAFSPDGKRLASASGRLGQDLGPGHGTRDAQPPGSWQQRLGRRILARRQSPGHDGREIRDAGSLGGGPNAGDRGLG
jgi:WD40 repeat protein